MLFTIATTSCISLFSILTRHIILLILRILCFFLLLLVMLATALRSCPLLFSKQLVGSQAILLDIG